jgi:hypothetical protein
MFAGGPAGSALAGPSPPPPVPLPPASLVRCPACWSSRTRVMACLWGSPALWVSTWAVSYTVWLAQGCLPFMPFVSDFGAASSPTGAYFGVCMSLAALLWCPTWLDYYWHTKPSLANEPAGSRYSLLHSLQPVCGFVCSLGGAFRPVKRPPPPPASPSPPSLLHGVALPDGSLPQLGLTHLFCVHVVIGVAVDPEDERLIVHGASAGCLFVSGLVFNSISTVLCYHREGITGAVKVSAAATALAIFAYFGMLLSLSVTLGPAAMLKNGTAANSFHLAHKDWGGYCRGAMYRAQETLHGYPGVNWGASFEWTMLLAMLINIQRALWQELRQPWPYNPVEPMSAKLVPAELHL